MATFIKKQRRWLLFLVFLIALLTRTFALSEYPVHLAVDEIANGYNAYTILTTGEDEWGEALPFTFKSFDDYKPPVHIYLIVPFLSLFGNIEFAVRFPIALVGALTVFPVYSLVKKLVKSEHGALFAAFWLALSPWHIHFSRGTFEAVLALFFVVSGVSLFYHALDKKYHEWAALSAAFFSLAVWSYHAQRAFVPLFVVFLIYINRKKIFQKSSLVLVRSFIATSAFFALPLIHLAITTPAITTRAQSTSILRDSTLLNQLHHGEYESTAEFVFDNDLYIIFKHWAGQYLSYFDLSFWFWDGLELTFAGFPDIGLLYTPDILLFGVGVYALTQIKLSRLRDLAIGWALLGPLPASVTMNAQHPLRALVWLPFFMLVVSVGFYWLIKQKKRLSKGLLLGYIFALSVNGVYFFDLYTKQNPRLMSEFWGYGYKEIALWACEHEGEYENIYVSETYGDHTSITGSPQHYLGFFCERDYLEFLRHPSVPGIIVKRPFFPQDLEEHPNSVFIAAPWDFPADAIDEERIIKRQYFLNGKPSFIYVHTHPFNEIE